MESMESTAAVVHSEANHLLEVHRHRVLTTRSEGFPENRRYKNVSNTTLNCSALKGGRRLDRGYVVQIKRLAS